MRALIWILMFGLIYWALRGLIGGRAPDPDTRQSGGESEEMVRDPQCGVYLPVSSGLKRHVGGKTVHFCSRECEKAYKNRGAR